MNPRDGMLTFEGHIEVLRKALFRAAIVSLIFACVIFLFKDLTFEILLAPGEWDFCTYKWIEWCCRLFKQNFHFEEFYVELITTDLSSQFMTHVTTSIYLGLFCASPFILFELFRFVSPALLDGERKYSVQIVIIMYFLFIIGVLMSYFVIFPVSFRFLGTYSVAEKVHSTITLDSYISSFPLLTLLMGIVFQLPIISFVLGEMGFVQSSILIKYRRYAFFVICFVAAIITPPDVMTLVLVAVPLYLLYEVSIKVVKKVEKRKSVDMV